MTDEGAIQKEITDWLSTLPNVWFCRVHYQKPNSRGSQKSGVPDIVVESSRHGSGRIWIEVKTPKGKLTESQEREIPKMENAGATVLIVRSLKELQDALDEMEAVPYFD